MTTAVVPDFMTDPDRGCNPDHIDPDIFFSDNPADINDAIFTCLNACPFRAQCGAWADANNERFGVWAGEIRDMANKQKRARRKKAQDRARKLLADVAYYGAEVTWLTGRGRDDQHIATVLRTTVGTVAAIRDAMRQRAGVAA